MDSRQVDREIHRSRTRTHYAPEQERKRRYMPGLDELRALAVLAVIAYHLNPAWLPGGFLGVSLFFTLSGYLVTDLIVHEWETNGRFDLKRFWIRRARRLLPAMLGVLVVIVMLSLVFDPMRKHALQGDVLAALIYMNNWWFILRDVSYFESFGPASPLGHFWSLAIEEQFYLLWPLLLLPALRRMSRMRIIRWMLGLALGSAVLMAVLYVPGADPSRVYYGTDTRIFAILIGAVLAMVWPSVKLKKGASPKARFALNATGVGGLLLLALACCKVDEYQPFLYRGGFFLLALLSAVLIAVMAHPENRIGNRKFTGWLRWIGKRSYGLYLWHYPIVVLTTPATAAGEVSLWRMGLQLATTFLLAELSWRFLEVPLRELGLRPWLRQLRRTLCSTPGMRKGFALAAIVGLLLFSAGTVGLYAAGPAKSSGSAALPPAARPVAGGAVATEPPKEEAATAQTAAEAGKSPAGTSPTTAAETTPPGNGKPTAGESPGAPAPTPQPSESPLVSAAPPSDSPGVTAVPAEGQPDAEATVTPDSEAAGQTPGGGEAGGREGSGEGSPGGSEPTAPTASPAPVAAAQPVKPKPQPAITAIGDSVILDVQPYVEKDFHGIVVDGKVGRQMADAAKTISKLKEEGRLGDTIILELGTNGPFTRKQMDRMLAELADVKNIVLVNTRVPRTWERTVNKALQNAAAEDSRITLVDWHTESAGKSSYFAEDGVHLTAAGAKAYASLLKQTLKGL